MQPCSGVLLAVLPCIRSAHVFDIQRAAIAVTVFAYCSHSVETMRSHAPLTTGVTVKTVTSLTVTGRVLDDAFSEITITVIMCYSAFLLAEATSVSCSFTIIRNLYSQILQQCDLLTLELQ